MIVRAGAIGDTLMVTPAIRALHQRYPDSEIDFLCSAPGAALLATNPHLTGRHVLQGRNVPYFFSREKRRLVRTLRAREYDLAVLLESAPRYRELLERAGIAVIRSFRETPFDPKQHSIVNYLRTSGFSDVNGVSLDMELPVSEESRAVVQSLAADLPRPLIAIHAGYGPANRKKEQANRLRGWDPRKFTAVAERLLQRTGGGILFTGSSDDQALCQSIATPLPSNRYRILAGRTNIPQFAASIQMADLLVSVDSSAAHIAAAVGTPVVVLWGPAILQQTRPLSSATPITTIQKFVPCGPCYGTPLMKTCRRNICMEQIEPEEVAEQAARYLAGNALPILAR